MDTLSAELIMRKHKVHENIIAQMAASEAALPPDGMLNDWGPAPAIAGLTAAESELLVIRMDRSETQRFEERRSVQFVSVDAAYSKRVGDADRR